MNSLNKRLDFGQRVLISVRMSGLKVEDFCKQSGIPQPTLYAWTSGRNPFSSRSLKRLMLALLNFGVRCDENWILKGIGAGPQDIRGSTEHGLAPKASLNSDITYDDELKRIQEIEYFKKLYNNCCVATVTDDVMGPFFEEGDVVGGLWLEDNSFKDLDGKYVIVMIDGKVLVRLFRCFSGYNDFLITNLYSKQKNSIFLKASFEKIAPIVWHRKKNFIPTAISQKKLCFAKGSES